MADRKISQLPAVVTLDDDDLLTVVDVSEIPADPEQANAKISVLNARPLFEGPQGDPGTDGLGWTGGSYNPTTGVVTFTSDDGLGFSTGDLRGADGEVAFVTPPASPSDTGTIGQMAWSSPYLYLCVATDTWVRWVPARAWT